jgi:hypothetical protein
MGDGSCFENSRAKALGVRLPLLPPCALGRLAKAPVFQAGKASSILAKHSLIGDRLTAGRLALNQAAEVQLLLPEL